MSNQLLSIVKRVCCLYCEGGYLEISRVEVLSDAEIPRLCPLPAITVADANFLLFNRCVILLILLVSHRPRGCVACRNCSSAPENVSF